MADKELVMKLEEDISWLEQGCTTEKEICEHIKQAIKTIIQHKETENTWHTGTPTDEGWYVMKTKHGSLFLVQKNSYGFWIEDKFGYEAFVPTEGYIIAWMPIEPYKE